MYIAIETSVKDCESLQCLSAKIMRWDECTWIFDLHDFLPYWETKAKQMQLSVFQVLQRALKESLELKIEDIDGIYTIPQQYSASFSDNPWLTILLLKHMKSRQIQGLVKSHSPFGQRMLKDISWELWWDCLEQLGYWFEENKMKNFRISRFRQQIKLMNRSVNRLGYSGPNDLKALNFGGVKRRFGNELAQIWQWFCNEPSEFDRSIGDVCFPWKDFYFEAPIQWEQCLDESLFLWDQIELNLQEGFAKLFQQIEHPQSKVLRIIWTVRLDDFREIKIPISFRHPYNPSSESSDYPTALMQAKYAFNQHARDFLPQDWKEQKSCQSDILPVVISWNLSIVRQVYLHPQMKDLFGEFDRQCNKELQRLENELPIPLQRFLPNGNWIPEFSFSESSLFSGNQGFSSSFICSFFFKKNGRNFATSISEDKKP